MLPAQNTSGNWVKVVQRIPVRIRVDRKPGDPELRAGMSVEAEIDTGHQPHSRRPLLDRPIMAEGATDQVPHRLIITLCTVGATLMQALDQTIANVALPYMQGSLSASFDEITWVLTSYITAAAIMTAPVGWLAARFGRKYLFITCLIGFTITSMMCGAAQSLDQMVVFRLLQGMFGAALVPLSQATMLDIYPAEQRGSAMAIWGVGVMVGPILGPTLGGYLTEMYNWRWVFYVNLPFGILATLGLIFFMPRTEPRFRHAVRLDRFRRAQPRHRRHAVDAGPRPGPGLVQLAREIIVEAVLGGLGIYLFVVHMLTARRPFIPPALFKDRNFSAGVAMMFAAGTILVSSSALMAPWLQNLANYPVDTAGLIMAPRGIGTMAAMVLAGPHCRAIDPRIADGLRHHVHCLVDVGDDDLDAGYHRGRLIITIVVQGFGLGFLFIPLQMMAFATLPVSLRTDGASLFSLFAQYRRGHRRVRHLGDAGAQHAGAARGNRRATSTRSIARCRMAVRRTGI